MNTRLRLRLPASPTVGGRRFERRPLVLVLNHFATPRTVGGGTRHVELFSRLITWEVVIVCAARTLLGDRLPVSGGMVDGNVSLQPVWVSSARSEASRVVSWATYALTAFYRALRLRCPDVVYASSPHLLAGATGLLVAKLRGAHFVFEVRDLWPQVLVDMRQLRPSSQLYRLLSALEELLYNHAEAIVVLAPGVHEQLTARGYGPKIWEIPNAADVAEMETSVTREEARRKYGLEGFVVVYAGAHGRANGLDLLLDTAGAMVTRQPAVRFLLVGDGPMKRGLIQRAAEERLVNVRFLDPIPKSEIPTLFRGCDAGVHVLADVPLFRYGVSPNKLFDYMAAGLPVITNTGGDTAHLVQMAGAGLAVGPKQLAQGIAMVAAASREQLRAWSTAGQAYVVSEASRAAMARRLQMLLDSLVGEQRHQNFRGTTAAPVISD